MKELPEELLWTVLGFLDVRTLCTARLVCRQFRLSASDHLKALQLDCTDLEQRPTSSLTGLSGLTHLEVSIHCRDRLPLLSHLGIAPLITHVRLGWECFWNEGSLETFSHISFLPMLRSLALPARACNYELLPLTLEELHLGFPVEEDASSLTRLSGLTNLDIDLSKLAGQLLETLTSLRSLRSLTLRCGLSALGVLSRFTMLTGLAWNVDLDAQTPGGMFLELAHLTGLSELRLSSFLGEVTQEHSMLVPPDGADVPRFQWVRSC